MKFAFLAAALVGVASAAVDLDDHSVPVKTRFAAFAKQFGKLYDTPDARDAAFAAFAENDLKIRDYNSRGLEYTLGHNEFSDLFADDFNAKMLGGYQEPARERNYDTSLSDPARVAATADAKDWVTLGAVTPIKNQGQCGSCWAFSTVMGIEGDLFVEQGKLVSLSEQDLVSCDTGSVNQGCQGGLMDDAFQWVEANGICTEADYPYTSGTGTTGLCQKTCKPAVKVANYTDVPQEDEAALLTAVDQQPVSVAIEADKSVFQLYKSGVLRSPLCGKQLDHGVGIVGYGASEIGTKYWKVKNSWGASWGMEGYILMERDVDQCGISQSASFPTGATQLQEPKPMTFIKR